MKKLCFNLVLSATFVGIVACHSKQKSMSENSEQTTTRETTSNKIKGVASASDPAQQIAAEQNTQFVTEVTFDEGSYRLSESAKRQISSLLSSLKTGEKVEDVKVISWSDQAYPRKGQPQLSKDQERIAEARNKEIQKFIHSQNIVMVVTDDEQE